jgi:hypothetical protein
VGKTVLLRRIGDQALGAGLDVLTVEAPEGRSLPAMLAPQLRAAMLRLSARRRAVESAQRALRAVAGFAQLRARYADLELVIDLAPEPGLADSGDLDSDLRDVFEACAIAAKETESALVLMIDELQYVPEPELASLVVALHACAQRNLPITLVGAGLPQVRGQFGDAKSYAERMFEFPMIGPLSESAARDALNKPVAEFGVRFLPSALDHILERTQCYPYFLQEWGKASWDSAAGPSISLDDARQASVVAEAVLDASFFRVRFDRLRPSEKEYLRAMAELGAGPHASGAIATQMGRKVASLAPTRASLIAKGMVWSPAYGDTAFTVPLFDEFMRRIMP